MANRNVYPNCVLIILSTCYIRFIIIFQIFNFVLAFSTFSVAFLFCLLQTSFWKSSRKAFYLVPLGRPRWLFTRSNLISSRWIWLEFKLIQYFMPVLVICKFDDDPIKNTGATVSTTFLSALKAGNYKVNGRIWLEFELIQDFMPWLPVSLIMIRSILKALSCPQHFLHYISLWEKFRYSRACNPEAILRSGPKSNTSGILCLPWLKALACP